MVERDCVDKTGLVIQGVLAMTKRRLSAAEIIDMVYLVDNRFYECVGRTLTGTVYIRNCDVPDAQFGSITASVHELAYNARISVFDSTSEGGDVRYGVDDPAKVWGDVIRDLNSGEYLILREMVERYGGLANVALSGVAKATKAVVDAEPDGRLRFAQSEGSIRLQKKLQDRLDSDPEFAAEFRRALDDTDEEGWVWHEDLP